MKLCLNTCAFSLTSKTELNSISHAETNLSISVIILMYCVLVRGIEMHRLDEMDNLIRVLMKSAIIREMKNSFNNLSTRLSDPIELHVAVVAHTMPLSYFVVCFIV